MTTATRHPDLAPTEVPPVAREPVGPGPSELDDEELRHRVDTILSRRATVGFALGVVRDGRLESFHARGSADVATGTPITEDTVFRIASITKTFTAIAIMQLWEQGRVDLDAPANDYLRAYRLIPAKPGFRPATMRHLLTHTAGIPEILHPLDLLRPDWGDSIAAGARMPSLAEYYGEGIRLETESGTVFTYTNHGYATLGQIVEELSGMPFDRYLRQRIFEPLGMADTDLLRSQFPASRRATGYALGAHGPVPVTDRDWVTAGASSIYSTMRDVSRYAAALMAGGTNSHGTILRPETTAMMFAPHFQPDLRVPGMGLGFDRNPAGGHLVVGHGGILPGFNSQLLVAPDDRVGIIAFTTGAHLAMLWLPTELGRLMSRLIGVPEDAIRTDLPQRPEVWNEICGRYEFAGRLTDIRARLMTGAGARVAVRGDELVLRLLTPLPALLRGLPLHPDDPEDPYAFRVDLTGLGLPTARIVFSREEGKGVTALHLDLFPMSLRRRTDDNRRRAAARRALVGTLVAGTAVVASRRRAALRRRPVDRPTPPAIAGG